MWRRNLLALGLILLLAGVVAVIGSRRVVGKGFFAPPEEPKVQIDPKLEFHPLQQKQMLHAD